MKSRNLEIAKLDTRRQLPVSDMIRRNVPAAACAMELVGDKLQPGGKQAERPAPGLAHVTLGLVPKPRIGIVGRVDEKWIASCSELQAPRSSTDPKLATDRTLGKLSVTCGPACSKSVSKNLGPRRSCLV